MSTFSQDEKWMEAKKTVGNHNWLEVVSYYRFIGGRNVFVYSVIEGDKRLIVDVLDDGDVLLISKHGEPVVDNYDTVLSSRKVFKYNEDSSEECDITLGSRVFKIVTESHN
jgi:hypothetical protein